MAKQDISKRLQTLAASENSRPKAARLREVMDDVEAALKAGVSRAAVLNELKAAGLEMSLANFASTLRRARAARRKAGVAPTLRQPEVQEKTELTGEPSASHNPSSLDKIMRSTPDLFALAKLAKEK